MKKTFSNIIYNAVYQILIIAIPMITVPYVARILGSKDLGINSYVMSITIFLCVIIMLSMNQLGVKTIAESTSENILDNFRSLWGLQLITGIIVLLLFIMTIILFLPYKILFLLELPYMLGYIADVSWFYIGTGEVKRVVLRNTVIKILSVILIFILVNSRSDLWMYMMINSASVLFANLIFWWSVIRRFGVPFFDIQWVHARKFLKNSVILALPQVVVQFYTNIDSTIVGALAGPVQLSYYDQSQKMARIVLTILTSVSTVIMPRLVQVRKKDNDKFQRFVKASLDYTLLLGLYFVLILMVNAHQFVPWFFGAEFSPMVNDMLIVSSIIVFNSYGGVFANQYAVSVGLFKEFAIPYYVGAIVSLCLNLLIVERYGAMGGTIVLVITELLVCIIRIFLLRRHFRWSTLLHGQIKYIFSFFVALLVGFKVPVNLMGPFSDLVCRTVIVTLIYGILLLLLQTRIPSDFEKIKK